MVGAGFSRNAEKARPDAYDPPTWRDLVEAMCDKLYPQGRDKRRQSGTAATLEPSSPVRLAQEYETAFGRDDLHRFIRQLVRDEDFKPGNMHSRLLQLPWRDVFTTNWDTLLERTRRSVVERAYSVVHNMDEIPLAARPRIVKLHGSVPAHFPLVFTEEDYRTYPVKFAPFVNTAQQAMMETVLCLVGFSGDDPNFLHWSGWVRDNLGRSAPKIYLAGWLNLPPHRRSLLEDRNVVPIDLSRHPKSYEWPEHLRDRYAADWLLHALEYGRPYVISNWPSPCKRKDPAHSTFLEPLQRADSKEPRDEPKVPQSEEESTNLLTHIRELLGVWSHNRETYPGWLIIPREKYYSLSLNTQQWEPVILRFLPEFEPVDQLNAIRELIWRRELLLEPISSDLETAAQAVLGETDCQNRTISGVVDMRQNWAAVREAWLLIALALVTVARQHFDHDEFKRRIDSLSPFLDDNRDIAHRLLHERCLWEINSLDYKALEDLLKDWRTENCDPVWMMRKSALLFETGFYEDAYELIMIALMEIRENPGDNRSIVGPSCESWALFSTLKSEDFGHGTEYWRRWEELTSLKCNAPEEKRRYAEAIKGIEKNTKGPPFDLGMERGPEITISNSEYYQYIAAHQAIRLTEVAGLPPSTQGVSTASNILGMAADELFQHEPELAVRLVLRITKYDQDERLNVMLSRAHMAAMSADSVKTIARICVDAIEFALPKIAEPGASKRNIFWTERLRVVMEALSRFSVRFDPEMADAIFDKALYWYGNRKNAWEHWLAQPLGNVLTRSWKALPEQKRKGRIFDILSTSIAGMDDFSVSSDRYPEPGYLLTKGLVPPDRETDEKRCKEIIDFLMRGLRLDGEARKRAAFRIFWMTSCNLLVDDEKSLVAHALWGDSYNDHNNLPSGTDFFDWEFLVLPEPVPGIAEQRFRRKWLSEEVSLEENPPHIEDALWQVGCAIYNLKFYKISLTFSDQEKEYLATLIARWIENPMPISRGFDILNSIFQERKNSMRRAILGLVFVLLEICLSEPVAKKLYDQVRRLSESDTPALSLAAGLIKSLPTHFHDIVLSMRMALGSDDRDLVRNATTGLWFWLQFANDLAAGFQPPPVDLVREIGVIIATRRKTNLDQALQIARWIFMDGNPEQRDAIGRLASQGLGYLAQELRYDKSRDPDIDVPLLRWGCTHLALAMAAQGFDTDAAVARWVENAETDPLPEIRHAKRAAGERQNDAVSNADFILDYLE